MRLWWLTINAYLQFLGDKFTLSFFHHYVNSSHEIYIFRINNKRETAPECEYDFLK